MSNEGGVLPAFGPAFDPGFSTDDMTQVFSAEARVQSMCKFEAALAAAGADAGVVPAEIAAEIERACAAQVSDAGRRVLAEGWQTGSPVIVLLSQLRDKLSPEAGALIHHGATTQDVVDSALMIQIRAGLQLLDAGLVQVASTLRDVAFEHRATPMTGRTFLQHAVPTTFGLRVAQWLEPIIRQLPALRSTSDSLPVQLGGPVGNQATLGAHAATVTGGLAERLGLVVPLLPWHTDRSRLAEVVALVTAISSSMAKIGTDLTLLSQSEVGEVRTRPGGSSSMPHKRNPIDPMRAVAAARVCAATAHVVTAASPHELERSIGSWHAEWFAVPVVFQTAGAAVEAIGVATRSMEVDVERMSTNLGAVDGKASSATTALVDQVLAAAASVLGIAE